MTIAKAAKHNWIRPREGARRILQTMEDTDPDIIAYQLARDLNRAKEDPAMAAAIEREREETERIFEKMRRK